MQKYGFSVRDKN